MAKGKMVVLTNPVSAAREADFNKWYDEIHVKEVCAVEGIRRVTRFRTKAQLLPPKDTPSHRYCAIYDLDDVDVAMKNLAEAAPKMQYTDAVDPADVLEWVFEPMITYEKP